MRESIHGYQCPKTKQTIDASYQTFLDQLPPILILHLKLFIYDKDGGSKKLVKKIDYPIDLELPRECLHMDRGSDKNKYSKSYKLLSGKKPFLSQDQIHSLQCANYLIFVLPKNHDNLF